MDLHCDIARGLARGPARDLGRGPARYWAAIAAILIASAVVRLKDLSADAPLDGARDLSLSTDGAWYSASALDRADGRGDTAAHPSGRPYERPIYSLLVSAAVRAVGRGIEAPALVAVFSSLVVLFLTAEAARRASSPAAGIVAAALLSLDFNFLVHSRSPNLYMTVAAIPAAIVWLLAPRRGSSQPPSRLRVPFAWGAALAGALWLKDIVILLVPALIWAALPPRSAWKLARRPAVLAAEAAGLAAAGIGAAAAVFLVWKSGYLASHWHKLHEYATIGPGAASSESGGILWRVLTLESRAGIFAMSPALAVLAAIGFLYGEVRSPIEKLARGHAAVTFAALALLEYSPIRYLLPIYPACALLASLQAVDGLRGLLRPSQQPLWQRQLRVATAGYLFLQAGLALTGRPSLTIVTGLLCTGLSGAALIEWAIARGTPVRLSLGRAGTRCTAALGLCLVLPGVFRGGVALAEPRHSLAHAGAEMEAVLSPHAHLTGLFAHALTYSSAHRRTYISRLEWGGGKLGRHLRREGFTHMAVDMPADAEQFFGAFRADGAALEPVWEFTIRGARVGLYRFPWAGELCPLSDFERGIAAWRTKDLAAAERELRRAFEGHPEAGTPASALGLVLRDAGRDAEAIPLLEEALRRNPDTLQAARALVGIHLKNQNLAAARGLLADIARRDPADREAHELAEKLTHAGVRP